MFRRMKSRRSFISPVTPRRAAALGIAFVLLALSGFVAPGPSADAYTGSVDSANARYVVASYQQLLGRDPADAGLDRYLARIAAGGDRSRQQMARELLYGTEGSASEVRRAYQTLLGRSPEAAGSQFWTSHLQTNDVMDLRVLLMSSDEYVRRSGGNNSAWVTALYRDVLKRPAEPKGLAYWTNLANGGTPRPLIVAGFYLSAESLRLRTDTYYRLTLDRAATGAERAEGAALIAASGERALYAKLWASDEVFETYFDLGVR